MLPSFDDNANRKTDTLAIRRLPTPPCSPLAAADDDEGF